MVTRYVTSNRSKLWPWLAILALIVVGVILLRSQGRLWICSCGQIYLWSGDIWSSDNSQHLSDPYTFTHVLHGFLFFWLLAWSLPRLTLPWQLWLALAIETLWEVIENSEWVIQRYREATLALGYEGDTIINSLGDILACGFGFMLARQIGFRRSFVLFVLIEVILTLWIKDSLLLNIVMLLYPIEAIKTWQFGQ